MHDTASSMYLIEALILLSAALISLPLCKRFGMGIVPGYLIAGIIISPWEQQIFDQSGYMLVMAKFGVTLLLFIIGLEMTPARLWKMRMDVFGLGLCQVAFCGTLLSLLGKWAGFSWPAAVVCGFALSLSSTALALQFLQEHAQLRSPYGQKTFAILLFQDLCVIPLLSLVAFLAPGEAGGNTDPSLLEQTIRIITAVLAMVLAGRFLLNPLFKLLTHIVNARDIMIIAALLIIIGASYLTKSVGLSMELGAFLAGIMLADSPYRHQIEADMEPFRTLLLGLFFMSMGMSIDLGLALDNWSMALSILLIVMLLKSSVIWALARMFGASNADSLRIAVTIPQGGEFALVIASAALGAQIIGPMLNSLLSTTVILSMSATPLMRALFDRTANRLALRGVAHDTLETFESARAKVIIVGFGRFGQVTAQMLMADDIEITAIDHNPRRIALARKAGYKIHYGDATRMDVLQAAGAANATMIALCFNNRTVMNKVIDAIRVTFPKIGIFCRASDYNHVLELRMKKVDFEIRETFESGIVFGRAALEYLELSPERITAIENDIRAHDHARIIYPNEEKFAHMEIMPHHRAGKHK